MMPAPRPALALAPVPASTPERVAWEGAYLTPDEASLVGARAAEKRRAEFVAGRVAAKAAAALLLGRRWNAGEVAVLRERGAAGGRPRLSVPGGCRCEISISHADGLAVAAASVECVGIDLVAIEHYGPAFEAEAFARGELERWRSWLGGTAARDEAVALAFAAKEAALKWLGTGLTVPLQDVAVAPLGLHAPPRAGADASTESRVLKVGPGGRDAFLPMPQTCLRVAVDTARPRSRSELGARLLRLEDRVVFLLWGSDGRRRLD